MSRRLSRRKFLQTSAVSATAAGFWLTGGITESRAAQGANERLNIAIIGAGGQGSSDLGNVAGENIVALCDVDENRAADAFQRYPKAKRFRDYRKMLDVLHPQIDAVVVSIPDHMHAPVSLAAMELGKQLEVPLPTTGLTNEFLTAARGMGYADQDFAALFDVLADHIGLLQGIFSGVLNTKRAQGDGKTGIVSPSTD